MRMPDESQNRCTFGTNRTFESFKFQYEDAMIKEQQARTVQKKTKTISKVKRNVKEKANDNGKQLIPCEHEKKASQAGAAHFAYATKISDKENTSSERHCKEETIVIEELKLRRLIALGILKL